MHLRRGASEPKSQSIKGVRVLLLWARPVDKQLSGIAPEGHGVELSAMLKRGPGQSLSDGDRAGSSQFHFPKIPFPTRVCSVATVT